MRMKGVPFLLLTHQQQQQQSLNSKSTKLKKNPSKSTPTCTFIKVVIMPKIASNNAIKERCSIDYFSQQKKHD
jgi:hypothetical protein